MKLLVVTTHDELIRNGYFITLNDYFSKQPAIKEVAFGIENLWDHNLFFDIYHFQWPECIFHWEEPSLEQIDALDKRLHQIKKYAKIVITIHNEYPHYRNSENFQKLYNLVIENSDLVVHMGRFSKQVFDIRYPFIPSVIIPHHNYQNFRRLFSKNAARRKLGIPEDKILFVTVGRIRHPEEANLLLRAFMQFKHPQKYLMVLHGDLSLGHYRISRLFKRIFIAFHVHIKWINHYVSDDMMQLYLCASDILIIPRFKPLNSGNLILGFNFGKVVVGPDYGNVGEILKDTGNPTFDPCNMESVLHAFDQAIALLYQNKGESNFAYAMQNWSIEQVGAAYVECYKRIMNL